MTTFKDIYCFKCNCKTDQALMLSCEHNLCMNCAAKDLNEPSQQPKQYIVCDLCGSKTEIDHQTSQEIFSYIFKNLNLNPHLLNSNNKIKQNFNRTENINGEYSPSFGNNEIFLNSMDNINNAINNNNLFISNANIVNRKNICSEHGEPLSYLCLDCMTKCICSECIVHGEHHNHDVLNIKKAYPLIFGKIQDLYKNICDKIKELDNSKRNIEKKKSSINMLNQKCKNEIKNAFQIIRIRLNEKEKEIIEKTDSTLNENLNELNTYEHVIQSKIANMNKIIDSLNAYMMRKDELNLINYYCDNKNKIISQMEDNENNCLFNLNTISNLKINIDKSSFDNMLISLNNLDFEINSFKGIDINNHFDTAKYTAQRNLYGFDFKNKKNDLNLNLITCNCKIKSEINKETEPPRLDSILLDLLTDSSFGVIKCLSLVLNFHNKSENIGFWIFILIIIAHIIIIIHYSIKTINPINRYILTQMKKFYYIAHIYNPVKKRKSEKKNKFDIFNKFHIKIINQDQTANRRTIRGSTKKIFSIRKRKTHFSIRFPNKHEDKDKDSSNNNLADLSRPRLRNKSKTMIIRNNKDFFAKQKKLTIFSKKINSPKNNTKINYENDYNLIQINANNSSKNIPPESQYFLDNYNYTEAIKYDKRPFSRIYYICILTKENMLNIILVKSPLELQSLRICLLIFTYSCDLAMNTVFYFNSNISDKYYYNGNNKFFFTMFNNLSISIISTFISLALEVFFKVMITSKDDIEDLFRNEERKMRKNSNYVVNSIRKKQILMNIFEINKKLKIKIIIFFISEFLVIVFFFYFVTAFCEVYKNSQISWITDSIVSFFLSFPIEFGNAFLIAVFYKISVQSKCKWLYKIAMFLYNL